MYCYLISLFNILLDNLTKGVIGIKMPTFPWQNPKASYELSLSVLSFFVSNHAPMPSLNRNQALNLLGLAMGFTVDCQRLKKNLGLEVLMCKKLFFTLTNTYFSKIRNVIDACCVSFTLTLSSIIYTSIYLFQRRKC